ncbi:hypothetical protein RclHR1_02440014 [Rhizophagus clarus]|uniref:Kinase-like domain-containing protein n=1 Tax=Rhizophagus clarus TaxID=94130 RepID=A0A2Z6QXX7_9GLOM|nr:hypothetical protein RclHR1_02440014 [Rhizophagus clarus]GES73434.1 kinase-like domain-containing protein [Rhizophagus clarus]
MSIFNKRKKNEGQSTNSVMDVQSLSQEDSKTKKSKGYPLKETTIAKELLNFAQNFESFAPIISKICKLGGDVIDLYEKAQHNKELCGFILKRCNCAVAAVKDLDIRRTEYIEFFSKERNFELLKAFSECIEKSKEFISRVSKLHKLMRYLFAGSIENDLNELVKEFDGYMMSLNFSFTMQTRDDSIKIKDYVIQIHELLYNVYNISNDKQQQKNFYGQMDLVITRLKKFQIEDENANSDELITSVEKNEPLLNGINYQKTESHSSEIEKRISFKDSTDVLFKEFSNIDSSTNNIDTQIEIRRQVNILKILRNSDHIIRFFGVAQENSKFYLVTEWMDKGNLCEYYTKFRDNINWKTKIGFSLDICRGVTYLHDCEILHHDIRSANILVNKYHKVKIANFGLSRKFSDVTRSVSHDSENVRYMAPEKLLLGKDEKRKYDIKCEIYSVGMLLWEIAELKKPHSDLDKLELTDIISGIRKRIQDKYYEPFSDDVPRDWQLTVSKAIDYEPKWRPNMSDICRDFYKFSENYSKSKPSLININILPVNDAIKEHKLNNGDKQLAWNSFKYYSITNVEARYWVGYYLFYHGAEIPELQSINNEERNKIAVDIFKETADKGNPSAQLRYGMYLWDNKNYIEALKYIEMSANAGDNVALYIAGKAYWDGVNGIEQDKEKGAKYLKDAALKGNAKAREMCGKNDINY